MPRSRHVHTTLRNDQYCNMYMPQASRSSTFAAQSSERRAAAHLDLSLSHRRRHECSAGLLHLFSAMFEVRAAFQERLRLTNAERLLFRAYTDEPVSAFASYAALL